MYLEDESHSYHISSLMDRKMKGEKLDGNLEKDSTCCVRIINHRGREVRPYPQKAKEEIVLLIIQKGVVKHILWLVCNSRR